MYFFATIPIIMANPGFARLNLAKMSECLTFAPHNNCIQGTNPSNQKLAKYERKQKSTYA